MTKRIVLIHAVTTAIPPMLHAFREGWPETQVSNLLDDDLAKRLVAIPALKPDEAMIAAALDTGKRIGVVATNPPAGPAAEAQLRAAAATRGMDIQVLQALADGAFAAGNAGDFSTHDRLVVEAAERIAGSVDVICLAQVSMALARPAVQARVNIPVLTSPATAVARLKALLSGS